MDVVKETIKTKIKDKVKDTIKNEIKSSVKIVIYSLLVLLFIFFIMYSWYDALQLWCEFWVADEKDKNDIYKKAVGDTIFASILTVFLILVAFAIRP